MNTYKITLHNNKTHTNRVSYAIGNDVDQVVTRVIEIADDTTQIALLPDMWVVSRVDIVEPYTMRLF